MLQPTAITLFNVGNSVLLTLTSPKISFNLSSKHQNFKIPKLQKHLSLNMKRLIPQELSDTKFLLYCKTPSSAKEGPGGCRLASGLWRTGKAGGKVFRNHFDLVWAYNSIQLYRLVLLIYFSLLKVFIFIFLHYPNAVFIHGRVHKLVDISLKVFWVCTSFLCLFFFLMEFVCWKDQAIHLVEHLTFWISLPFM